MPTQDDLTFCEYCRDSGDVETTVQHQDRPTNYIDCDHCPRCDIGSCGRLIKDAAGGGRISDVWACSPEHAADVICGSTSHEYALTHDLEDAAHMLKEMSNARLDGLKYSDRDFLLLARACALMAGSIVQDAHRFTEPPSIAEGTLSEFLPTLLGGKAS